MIIDKFYFLKKNIYEKIPLLHTLLYGITY